MKPGATTMVASPRWWTVSTTDSARRSRSSPASCSSPVASGTGVLVGAAKYVDRRARLGIVVDDVGQVLLGAAAPVAVAPALVGVVVDHRAQLEDPVHQRLGTRGAAGDVHVDRHELVGGDQR